MSTRTNIIIKDGNKKIYLYHHHDGYPEGVGMDLKEFLQKWSKIESWRYYGANIANRLIKRTDDYVNYELTDGIHGDIEYLYVIDCSRKSLKCYERKDWEVHGKEILRKDWEVEIPDPEESEK